MSKSRVLEAFTAALLDDDPRALYDQAPCGYLTLAPDGTVVKTNTTLRTMLRCTDDLAGTTLHELLVPSARVLVETHVMPMLRLQGAVNEVALELQCLDGTRLPALVNATAERDGGGRTTLVRMAVFDATERRRYEQELVGRAEEARAAQRAAEDAQQRLRTLVDTLQSSLVPRSLPDVPGLSVAGAYRPAGDGDQVGGDFFDVFPTDGEWWVVLGDVSGKGVDAAVVTALVRNGARALATSLPVRDRTPAHVLTQLDVLVDSHETERFCTVALLRMRRDGDRWALSYVSAGHPPLLLRPPAGPVRSVEAQNPPLGLGLRHEPGVLADGGPEQVELELCSGDMGVLHTDGISEAPTADGLWGDRGLVETLESIAAASVPAGEVADGVADGLVAHAVQLQGGRPRDDIACLVLVAD